MFGSKKLVAIRYISLPLDFSLGGERLEIAYIFRKIEIFTMILQLVVP